MKILRGRYAGQTGTLHQFANDWMTVDLDGGRQGVIVRPDQVQLDSDEHARVIDSPHVGTFWSEWSLNDDGTFTALRPRQPRRSRRTAATFGHCPDHPGPLDDARGHVCRLRPTNSGSTAPGGQHG